MSKGKRNRANRKSGNGRMMMKHLTTEQMVHLDMLLAEKMESYGVPFVILHAYKDGMFETVFSNK